MVPHYQEGIRNFWEHLFHLGFHQWEYEIYKNLFKLPLISNCFQQLDPTDTVALLGMSFAPLRYIWFRRTEYMSRGQDDNL